MSKITFYDPVIRPITKPDNPSVAAIIRQVMTEYETVGPGYSINDPEVDHMFEAYDPANSAFFVVEVNGQVQGCGGIGPLVGAPPSVCELKKMYFLPGLRGRGLGKQLLNRCLNAARALGYWQCYLETVVRMQEANRLYQKMGFRLLDQPLGNTGHNACEAYYLLDL